MWEVIREMVKSGTTLLLTTQYLEEADRLANEIIVIDHGQAIARGTADQLKSQIGGERVELIIESEADLAIARETLGSFADGEVTVDQQNRSLTAPVSGGSGVLVEVLRQLDTRSVKVLDVALRRPTLDDVFLTLTGHGAEDVVESAKDPKPEELKVSA